MRHGAGIDPPNRFEKVRCEADVEHLQWYEDVAEPAGRPIEYLPDNSQSIISENNSPDIPFRYSVNPYRGCAHGCAYCYARNTHEYLGMSAGVDFETKILVKHQAPQLLRAFLARRSWQPETITFSGVTDCYQPAERRFRLTRQCLEIALEARQPVALVSKNALLIRDLDVLTALAERRLVHVALSITTLDADLARTMEPRTSTPAARLRAVRMLSDAGVPVQAMVAPIIPGLNDSQMSAVLEAASEAGARSAGFILLRLPLSVEPVFREWLERTQPLAAERIESRVRACRSGEMSSSQWGERMRGHGPIAEQIEAMFKIFRHKHGLDGRLPPLDTSQFQPPQLDRQRRLF